MSKCKTGAAEKPSPRAGVPASTDPNAELTRLVTEAVVYQARLAVNKALIDEQLIALGRDEFKCAGGSVKNSRWTEYVVDEETAQAALDRATFERLFPRKPDNEAIGNWAASKDENRVLAKTFRLGKAKSRMTLSNPE